MYVVNVAGFRWEMSHGKHTKYYGEVMNGIVS